MNKSQLITAYAQAQVGSPYVFGATGQPCTPAYRRARIKQYPAHREAITKNCPVLAGRQITCAGCRHFGRKAFDCAQLTRRAAEAAGLSLPSGSRSQWTQAKWLRKGPIKTLPKGQVAFLYNVKADGRVPHTGMTPGDGTAIDARGHSYGVLRRPIGSYPWTHWAILPGMEMGNTTGKEENTMSLTIGSSGAAVKALQQELIRLQHDLGKWGADGKYGAATERAVEQFQEANDLRVSGVWGEEEQAVLDEIKARKPVDEDIFAGPPETLEPGLAARLLELKRLAEEQITIISAVLGGEAAN